MQKDRISIDVKRLLSYIKTNIVKEYPINRIPLDYFIVSVLDNEDCTAYTILEKVTISDNLNKLKNWYIKHISSLSTPQLINNEPLFDTKYDDCIDKVLKATDKPINSALLLLQILKSEDIHIKKFKEYDITLEEILECYNDVYNTTKENNSGMSSAITIIPASSSIIDPSMLETSKQNPILINLIEDAIVNEYDNAIVPEGFYDMVFTHLNTSKKNNVALVGEKGSGKTTVALNIANIYLNDEEPLVLQDRGLYRLNVDEIIRTGNFKALYKIMTQLNATKKSILIIDDIHKLLNEKFKACETDVIVFLYNLAISPNVSLLITLPPLEYDDIIADNDLFNSYFNKVQIEDLSKQDVAEILKNHAYFLSKIDKISFSKDVIQSIITLLQVYNKNKPIANAAIEFMNTCASYVKTLNKENDEIIEKRNELCEIDLDLKLELNKCSSEDTVIKSLKERKAELEKDLKLLAKKSKLNKKNVKITKSIVYKIFHKLYDIPEDLISTADSTDSFALLRSLDKKLKDVVIGQDDAIDIITKVVKKRKIGLSDPQKPSVFMFIGSTGTGKTYLSKQIAKLLFGNEKHFIKLDMSEYSDSISVNKLIGTSPGYVGYDNGGILIDKIKEHNECVILLDEIEKAHEKIHNLFLQLFDEGKLTNNTGETFDFSNCIIIMTSNVGAKEKSELANGLGFTPNTNKGCEITYKALKKAFKPEFINRINHIIYFNDLTTDNLRKIVCLEIGKITERMKSIGYDVDETITNTLLPDFIMNSQEIDIKMGARSIIRSVQTHLEDKVADYIINNNPPKPFTFSFQNLQ